MKIEFQESPRVFSLMGVFGKVENHCYGAVGGQLMQTLWKEVATHDLESDGINYWAYQADGMMFVGTRLLSPTDKQILLESGTFTFPSHARYLHVGPYDELARVHQLMRQEIEKQNRQARFPAMEIYQHRCEDQTKHETEVLIALQPR